MKSKKLKGKIHYIFDNKEEYRDHFLIEDGVVPVLVDEWRRAKNRDWVIADDGGIIQIIFQKDLPHPHDRKNYRLQNGYCRTIVGTFIQSNKIFMDTDFDKHPNRFRFNSATDAEYLQRRKTRSELSNLEVMFAAQMCGVKTIQQAYEDSFGPHHDWRNRAIFLLKRERIMSKIKENAKDRLNEKFDGDVLDFIFDQLKELILNAKNESIRLAGLKELAEWSGEKEKDKVKQITKGEITVFKPFGQGELAKIEAEEVKVLSEVDDD